MKFMVDRCAGRRLAEWLRSEGHDVVESRTLGPDPGDRELLSRSAEEGRILVTIDTDFGALIYGEHAKDAGLVRLPDVPAARRIQLMQEILRQHGASLGPGCVVTVRGNRIRVSRAP